MEVELVDLLARVESSQVLATIFSDPVDAVRAREHNEAVVDRTLHHLLDSANIRLTVFEDVLTRLVHVGVQLLPGLASVARSIDCAGGRLHEDDFVGVTAPKDVSKLVVDFEDLELDFVGVVRADLINHISCTSLGETE